MENERPKVGIGVFTLKNGKVLFGKRKSDNGLGTWGGVGGHLEHMESPEDCAKREALEEASIHLNNIKFLCLTNFITPQGKHYIDIAFTAETEDDPQLSEPEKFEAFDWYDIDNPPEPLFPVVNNYIEAYKTGRVYFG